MDTAPICGVDKDQYLITDNQDMINVFAALPSISIHIRLQQRSRFNQRCYDSSIIRYDPCLHSYAKCHCSHKAITSFMVGIKLLISEHSRQQSIILVFAFAALSCVFVLICMIYGSLQLQRFDHQMQQRYDLDLHCSTRNHCSLMAIAVFMIPLEMLKFYCQRQPRGDLCLRCSAKRLLRRCLGRLKGSKISSSSSSSLLDSGKQSSSEESSSSQVRALLQ